MKLYTIFDMDAEKCGPIFTAENEAICMRMVFSNYKDMPVYVSSRMQVLHIADMDLDGSLSDCDAPEVLLTIEEIVNSFLSIEKLKEVNPIESQH